MSEGSIVQEATRVWQAAEQVFGPQEVEAALVRMARDISAALSQRNPLVLCVMVGGVIPAGLLLPRLAFPLQLDYVHATRYRGTTSGGQLHWIKRPETPLRERVVLVIDDVLDHGATLAAIIEDCHAQGALAVYSAVLVKKRLAPPAPQTSGDFIGLETDDRYLFGCGMDYKTYLRNANGIYAVRS